MDNKPVCRTLSPVAQVYENSQAALALTEEIEQVSSEIETKNGFIWKLHQVMNDNKVMDFIDLYGKSGEDMDSLVFYIKLYQNIQAAYIKANDIKPPHKLMIYFIKMVMKNSEYRKDAVQAFQKFREDGNTRYQFVEKFISKHDKLTLSHKIKEEE